MSKPIAVVILGAGASNDCTDNPFDINFMPPLARDLFASKYVNRIVDPGSGLYQGAITFASTLKSADFSNIESVLTKRYEEAVGTAGEKHVLMQIFDTVYYLQALLKLCSMHTIKSTSYFHHLVVSLAKDYDVRFLTFNYDTLLEKAFSEALGHPINAMSDYISGPHKIIKLHGSCDWYYEVPTKQLTTPTDWFTSNSKDKIILNLEQVMSEGGIQKKKLGLEPYKKHSGSNTMFFPAMAVPFNTKDSFLEKKFIIPNDHITEAKAAMREASKVLIIGWKGEEEHFGTEMLVECVRDIPIVVVGKSAAGAATTKTNLVRFMPQYRLSSAISTQPIGFASFLRAPSGGLDSFIRIKG